MFVYALAQPIDFFDGLIPLPRWIAEDPDSNTAWALRATLALADARAEAGWTGGMRHLPSIGALPVPGTAELFMVIKQDTRGTGCKQPALRPAFRCHECVPNSLYCGVFTPVVVLQECAVAKQ